MVYDLLAIVGREGLFSSWPPALGSSRAIPLPQRLALIPTTDDWFDTVASMVDLDSPAPGEMAMRLEAGQGENTHASSPAGVTPSWQLTPHSLRWIAEHSVEGPIGYIEDVCHGGDCEQAGAVWNNGRLALGPLEAELGYYSTEADRLNGPVNQVLRWLGANRGDHRDEFVALQLGRYRRTEEWLEADVKRDGSGQKH